MFRPQQNHRRCRKDSSKPTETYNAQYLLLKNNSLFTGSYELSHLNKRSEVSIDDRVSMNETVGTADDSCSSENCSIYVQPEVSASNQKSTVEQSPSDSIVVEIRVYINISGRKYETYRNTLEYFPNTLLGNPVDRILYFDKKHREYFFERHATCFEAILYFYQSRGRLYRPKDIPIDIFIEELEFFKFDREIIMELMHRENLHLLPVAPDILPHNPYFRSIWLFFEYPTTVCAKTVSALSAFIIIVSVVCACLETIDTSSPPPSSNATTANNITILPHLKIESVFFLIEIFCNIWFFIEFLFRFISCPDKGKFMKNFLNLLDLFIMLTYLIMNVIFISSPSSSTGSSAGNPAAKGFNVLRVLKLVRVIRLFKLTKYTKLLQVLVLTLWASKQAIVILVSTIAIGVILFASLIYYAESNDTDTDFRNIPDCFWYTINVMTTVGDSDSNPKTALGKFFGATCAVTGIIVIAIPIPVIVANFSRYYQVLVQNTYCEYTRVQTQQKDNDSTVL